ncbi:MAG: metalloenzyme domain-containing protein [Planctomycetota bacterium]|nr:MAG: metalloenzyme domain-containing protein [Planctomycetota bacterium]REJ86920.1 MAG: metalloenzyme domain-containing protein [Planctomycetota bacterium]REK24953.1 MAG: metalloenzyme domain-containing protein [Planctomycetota bacterium]REK48542.1 MAG: metalloenzyme domain-containing protein [Planctomycetota bacterium]
MDITKLIGTHDVLFITLDTLRHDVAVSCLEDGRIPFLASLLPQSKWEERHTPGSFTYSAHHAFFAGFLPTPTTPGPHPRMFAAEFPGSETTNSTTFVYDAPTWVEGLRQADYHTICIGGVGFFNRMTALGRVLPDLFDESHWSPELGVTCADSTENQVDLACESVARVPHGKRLFLFLNVSAIHQPNCLYVTEAEEDSVETQAAALEYVDRCLPPLFAALRKRGNTLCLICSDHGTAYGEDGYMGHRISHPVVWTVPYAEFCLNQNGAEI